MAVDGSRLAITLEDGARWRRTMHVIVPADVVSQERNKAAQALAGRLKLPGFRKGRIPASVVEQRFGQALNSEALEKLIGEAYKAALTRESINPISEGSVEEMNYEPGQDLAFAISFDVSPELEFSRLGGFVAERPASTIPDGEMEKVLERLREQSGSWTEVTEGAPVVGDLVEVEVQPMEGDEPSGESQPYQFILGQGDAIPDVEAAIQTLEPGGEGRFTVRFPDDFPNEERRGEEEDLTVRLKTRRTMELPELSDEFAKSMGDFESLTDLEAKVTEDLGKEAENRAESAVRSQLLDFVLEANPFDVPDSMVARYLDSVLDDAKGLGDERLEELRDSLKPEAERSVKRILIIDRIAEVQGLTASEDEIDERVESLAERSKTSPAEVYARLQKSGQIESLEREITEEKVFEFLKEQSEITDATG
jgi:trigger factor